LRTRWWLCVVLRVWALRWGSAGTVVSTYADLARFAIAFTLAVAAVAKLGQAAAFRETLVRTGLVQQALIRPLAMAIPLLELGAGLALILSPVAGAITTILLFGSFSATAEMVHRRGRIVRCNCFAGLGDGELGRETALQNLLLTALTVLVLVRSPQITAASLPLGLAGITIASTSMLVISTFRQATRSRTSLLEVGAAKARHSEEAKRRAA
jgi:hypothetical protein